MAILKEATMALANYKPDAQLPTQPNLPKVEPDKYQSIIHDDKKTPIPSLLAYISGAPWVVRYYGQVLSKHNDLREIDPTQPNVYQQYQKTHNLELRVESAITSGYDTEQAITTVTGSALLYPFLVPNISDYFVADTADSRPTLFRLTNVERRTISRNSAFSIEYEVVGYIDDQASAANLYSNLEDKVIREYYFHKDRLVEGLQPMLRAEETQQIGSLRDMYTDIVTYYFKTFFNRKYMTLVLPGQDYAIYDTFLVNYIMKIIESTDAPEVRLMKTITTDNDPFIKQPQFWSIMYDRDYKGLTYCNKKMQLVTKYVFSLNSFVHGLAFSNIDYIVYPDEYDASAVVQHTPNAKVTALEEIMATENTLGNVADILSQQYVDVNTTYPIIKSVLDDGFYVLSGKFYNNELGQSLLEALTNDYLKMQTIDLAKLIELCSRYRSWGKLEQFYYGPILLTLIKEANRDSYS